MDIRVLELRGEIYTVDTSLEFIYFQVIIEAMGLDLITQGETVGKKQKYTQSPALTLKDAKQVRECIYKGRKGVARKQVKNQKPVLPNPREKNEGEWPSELGAAGRSSVMPEKRPWNSVTYKLLMTWNDKE